MDIAFIQLNNAVLNCVDLEDATIYKLIEHFKSYNYKYEFSFIFKSINPINDLDIEKRHAHAMRLFKQVFRILEIPYLEDDLKMLSLVYVLKNTEQMDPIANQLIEKIKELLKSIEYTNNEIIVWAREELQLYLVFLYACDRNNYINNVINNALQEYKTIIDTHDERLIFARNDE